MLRRAKENCDYLIVGVTIDSLVSYKNKTAVIPFEERIEIVNSIKYVDEAVPQTELDKYKAWEKYHFDVLFVGDDWKGKDNWIKYEEDLKKEGVDVVYFPYTKSTSSTILRDVIHIGTVYY